MADNSAGESNVFGSEEDPFRDAILAGVFDTDKASITSPTFSKRTTFQHKMAVKCLQQTMGKTLMNPTQRKCLVTSLIRNKLMIYLKHSSKRNFRYSKTLRKKVGKVPKQPKGTKFSEDKRKCLTEQAILLWVLVALY